MAKERKNISTIDAAMILVERAIEKLSKPASKDNKKGKDKSSYKASEREFNEDLQEFVDLNFKAFCKEHDLDKDKKKSVRKYCEYLCSFLPTVAVYARYMATNTETDVKKKEKIILQFVSDTFVDYVKLLVNDDKDIPNGLEYYPLIVGTIIRDVALSDEKAPDYLNDATKIGIWASQVTIEKLAKKCDCPPELAYQMIMAIPTKTAFDDFPTPWVKRKAVKFMVEDLVESEILHDLVSNKKIPKFDLIFDKMNINPSNVIVQVLTAGIPTDSSQTLALSALTDWTLDTLNGMDDDEQERVIRDYCFTANKIPNFEPRVIFSELPSEFIKLRNVATSIKNNKKFDGQFDKILK